MTDTFALEAVVSAAPYSNIHVRANNPAELSERLDGLAEALDKVRLLAAEGNLADAGVKSNPVDNGAWGNSGDGNSGVDNSPAAATGTQSYARQKPAVADDDPDQCAHGARVRREGNSARGAWVGFFCPLPKERKSEQCSPVWGKP